MNGTSTISAGQIKAARALLDWSQEDLADSSGLSIATIRKLEVGFISPRPATIYVLRRAFESAGIEFMDRDGVRRCSEEITTYKGAAGHGSFVDDVIETIQKAGGDLLMIDPAGYSFWEQKTRTLENVLLLNGSSMIKCLHTEIIDLVLSTPRFEHRFISRQYVDPLPFCVFGDKLALVVSGKGAEPKIVVMSSSIAAQASRRQFFSMWEKATPIDTGVLDSKKVIQRVRA